MHTTNTKTCKAEEIKEVLDFVILPQKYIKIIVQEFFSRRDNGTMGKWDNGTIGQWDHETMGQNYFTAKTLKIYLKCSVAS